MINTLAQIFPSSIIRKIFLFSLLQSALLIGWIYLFLLFPKLYALGHTFRLAGYFFLLIVLLVIAILDLRKNKKIEPSFIRIFLYTFFIVFPAPFITTFYFSFALTSIRSRMDIKIIGALLAISLIISLFFAFIFKNKNNHTHKDILDV